MPEVREEDPLAIARTLASAEREMEDVAVWRLAGCDEKTYTSKCKYCKSAPPSRFVVQSVVSNSL